MRKFFIVLSSLFLPLTALAQDLPPPQHAAPPPGSATSTDESYPTHTWALPPLDIPGKRKSPYREEERVGAYGQPRWTANRRFPTTRIYVVPAGKATFEYWCRIDAPLSAPNTNRRIRSLWEWELGLGHRLQLDLYLMTEQHGKDGPMELKKEQIELRYALADWGKLWGNPTLYLEYSRVSGDPDALEGKLLLGGELAHGLHAGANLVLERELSGEHGHEMVATAGLSKTVIDERFSLGAEVKGEWHDKQGSRFDIHEQVYMVGPSFSWSPIPPMQVLVTWLVGAGREDHGYQGVQQGWIIGGWTF